MKGTVMDRHEFLKAVEAEYVTARKRFSAFHSYHEGAAVLLEEVDELWDAVKAFQYREGESTENIRKEAVQVAAMAMAIVIEL